MNARSTAHLLRKKMFEGSQVSLYILLLVMIGLVSVLTGCPNPSTNDTPSDEGEVDTLDASFAAIEQRAFTLVNKERKKHKLPELELDEQLLAVARAHSQDMANNNYFSHTNLDGLSSFDRLEAADIKWKTAGENLAYNNDHDDPALTAVNSWINSPEHYENLLTEGYTHTGLGVGRGENGIYFFTQVFIGLKPSQESMR